MKEKFSGPALLLAASIITFLFNFFKVPVSAYQETVAIFIAVVIVFYGKLLTSPAKITVRYIILFSSSLLVQLLIISSGGILSPFLILFHIYTLGLSFFSLSDSLIFLVLTLTNLSVFVLVNPIQLELMRSDPGTVLLYGVSLLAIIPFSRLLATRYHLKVELADVLTNKLKLGDTILESLDEMIVVTDQDLNIISVNSAFERTLSASRSEILRRPLFDILFLRNPNGQLVSEQNLTKPILLNMLPFQNFANLFLYSKNSTPKKVTVRIRPSVNHSREIEQISFVINNVENPFSTANSPRLNLEESKIRNLSLLMDLKNKLLAKNLPTEVKEVELANRISQDINVAFELENHLVETKPDKVDIARLTEKSVISSTDFATELNVKLEFKLENFGPEKINNLIPQGFNVSPQELTSVYFTAPIDLQWFDFTLQKLIDLSLLLVSSQTGGVVSVSVEELLGKELRLKVCTNHPFLGDEKKDSIFSPFYPGIDIPTLKLGSGLEGYLTWSLARMLGLELSVEKKDIFTCFILMIKR